MIGVVPEGQVIGAQPHAGRGTHFVALPGICTRNPCRAPVIADIPFADATTFTATSRPSSSTTAVDPSATVTSAAEGTTSPSSSATTMIRERRAVVPVGGYLAARGCADELSVRCAQTDINGAFVTARCSSAVRLPCLSARRGDLDFRSGGHHRPPEPTVTGDLECRSGRESAYDTLAPGERCPRLITAVVERHGARVATAQR